MIQQNKVAQVWEINNNELNCKNKRIVILNYNNVEIAILKEEKDFLVQEILIKDKNREYWKLGIAPIRFNLFIKSNTIDKKQQDRIKKYKNDVTEKYKKIDLKAFWQKKITENKYFNKCELEYIYRFYPHLYEQAKESRKIFEENKSTQ